MPVEMLKPYWALLVAGALLMLVALVLGLRGAANSAAARLGAAAKQLRRCQRDQRRAERKRDKTRKRVNRLKARSDAVKPRLLDEAEGLCADAEALLKIHGDRVLVAQNELRGVIVEEFPPCRHDTLRNRFLPGVPLK